MSLNTTLYQELEQIQKEWELSDEQMAALTHVTPFTYRCWMTEGRIAENPPSIPLGMDTAVPLISIYRSLQRRYPTQDEQIKWLFTENNDFGGQKPIDIVASSTENLFWVSYYLDSSRN